MEGICRACLQPFRAGDTIKDVGNNEGTAVMGKKSERIIPVKLDDPKTSVWVHLHCVVLYYDPRSNEEFTAAVEEMKLPGWERDWKEENLDAIRSEAFDMADDRLKRICAACFEEIEIMGDEDADVPVPLPLPPLPWGPKSTG